MSNVVVHAFLLLNAAFWAGAPHGMHCRVADALRLPCVSHRIHIFAGLAFFVLFVGARQGWWWLTKLN
jgi:hypothetical protein